MNPSPSLDWLHVLLGVLVPVATILGAKIGHWLVTSGVDLVELKLKAAKHDELVPVVEAMRKGLLEGSDQITQGAVLKHAEAADVDDHPAIAQIAAARKVS